MPKYYNVSTMNYNNPKTYIDVELGDRRDLEEDFAIFNIDFSNGKFVLSDNDFGTINDASHLLTIDIFAKKKYAYVLFVDEKNNDIYFICYDIDN